jgi:inorganic pyrophosphatase
VSDLLRLPAFADKPDVFHVVVESPRGSAIKLKYASSLGAMSISRPLPLGLIYPYDWGFVPSTAGPDGDPVDAIVIWDVATFPGVVMSCRALALLEIEQKGPKGTRIRNDRIVAQPLEARREGQMPREAILTPRVRAELESFLLATTVLEGKEAVIVGWSDAEAAVGLIRKQPIG